MNKDESLARFNGVVFNATCINLIARFVQVARHEEMQKIHLQDKNVLAKVSEVAKASDNKHLALLYQRLDEELENLTAKKAVPHSEPWTVASTLKRWGLNPNGK